MWCCEFLGHLCGIIKDKDDEELETKKRKKKKNNNTNKKNIDKCIKLRVGWNSKVDLNIEADNLNVRAMFGPFAILIDHNTKQVVPLNLEGFPSTPLKLRARYIVDVNVHGTNSPIIPARQPKFHGRPWPSPSSSPLPSKSSLSFSPSSSSPSSSPSFPRHPRPSSPLSPPLLSSGSHLRPGTPVPFGSSHYSPLAFASSSGACDESPPCSPPVSPTPAISKSISLSTFFDSKSSPFDDPEASNRLLGPSDSGIN